MLRDEEMMEGERRGGEEEMEVEMEADDDEEEEEDNEVDGNEDGDVEDAGEGRDGGASSREEWFSQPASGAVPSPRRRAAHAESSHADVKHAAVSVHNLVRLLRCRETCSHAVDPALLKYSVRGRSTELQRRLQAWSEVGGLMNTKDRRSWRAVYSKSPPPTSSRVVMQPCTLEPSPRSTIAAAFSRCGRLLASTQYVFVLFKHELCCVHCVPTRTWQFLSCRAACIHTLCEKRSLRMLERCCCVIVLKTRVFV